MGGWLYRPGRRALALALCALLLVGVGLPLLLLGQHAYCHPSHQPSCDVCQSIAEAMAIVRRVSLAVILVLFAALGWLCVSEGCASRRFFVRYTPVMLKIRMND